MDAKKVNLEIEVNEAAGVVRRICVEVGDRVERGDTLMEIEWDSEPVERTDPGAGGEVDRTVAAPAQQVGDGVQE